MTDEIHVGREPTRAPTPGRHRRTLVMAGVVLAFLAAVAVVGLFRGQPTPTPAPSASPSSAGADSPPLQLTATRCAGLSGTRLTVGFGVENRGTQPLLVTEVQPTFPLGGLSADAEAPVDRTVCPAAEPAIPYILGPGDDVVLAFVVAVRDPDCIAPLPISVRVSYGVDGASTADADFAPFPDLGAFGLPSQC